MILKSKLANAQNNPSNSHVLQINQGNEMRNLDQENQEEMPMIRHQEPEEEKGGSQKKSKKKRTKDSEEEEDLVNEIDNFLIDDGEI